MHNDDNIYCRTAKKLKDEGQQLLSSTGLVSVLNQYGRTFYTGSFALNLMAWPDIDLYLVPTKGPLTRPQLSCLLSELSSLENLLQIKVEMPGMHNKNFLPKGIYIGVKLQYGNWRLPWKFDIWIVGEAFVNEKESWLNNTLEKLNPVNRAVILEQKHRFITAAGRTPSFSGYYIYEAVLDKSFHCPDKIKQHLIKNSIALPEHEFGTTPWSEGDSSFDLCKGPSI